MRTFALIAAFLMVMVSTPAYASHAIEVSVKGLVCDFCARALEKVFGKQEEVSSINVDLDTKIITIDLNEGQDMSDEKITELITDSGYNVDGITRHED